MRNTVDKIFQMMYNDTRAGMRLSTHPEGEPDPCAGYEHSRPRFIFPGGRSVPWKKLCRLSRIL